MRAWRFYVLGLLAFALTIDPARAGDRTIGFDDLSDGATIQNQYPGVTFLSRSLSNGADLTLPSARADSGAQSPPNVAVVECREICTADIVGQFSVPHTKVRVYVGDYGPTSETATIDLTVYDAESRTLGVRSALVTAGAGFHSSLEIDVAGIVYFEISSIGSKHIGIDNLTFDEAPAVAFADFSLIWSSGSLPVQLKKVSSNSTKLLLRRAGSSSGPIALSAIAPTGISVSFSPNPTSGPDGSDILVTLSATGYAAAGTSSITVTGAPSASAGTKSHSISIPYQIREVMDYRLLGIEVTQSIQSRNLPRRRRDPTAPVSYRGSPASGDVGVLLAAGGKTIVRVFASIPAASKLGSTPQYDAGLSICDSNGNNCGALMRSQQGPRSLPVDASDFVSDNMRASATIAFTFVLPPSATRGTIGLRAELFPEAFFSRDIEPCTDFDCKAYHSFTLTDIEFVATGPIEIAPVALQVDYKPLQQPQFVFADAAKIMPLAAGGLRVPDYVGTINISDIAHAEKKKFMGATVKTYDADSRGAWVIDRLVDRAEEWNLFDSQWLVIGVFPESYSTRIRHREHMPFSMAAAKPCSKSLFCEGKVAIVQGTDDLTKYTVNRPYASAAHELGHMLGRKHASSACQDNPDDNGAYEDWPPDYQGKIQGFGLDRAGASSDTKPMGGGPYRIIDPRSAVFDFMSYCAGNLTNGWISIRGWNEELGALRAPVSMLPPPPTRVFAASSWTRPMLAAALNRPVLVVRGIADAQGAVAITEVERRANATWIAPPQSAYHLIARDAAGKVLDDRPMSVVKDFADGGRPSFFLKAQTASVEARTLEITYNGAIVDRRQRNSRPPTLSVITPRTGAKIGESASVDITWRTRATTPTMVKIDYSGDSGTSWRPLYFGPDAGSVKLPPTYFPGAQCGMVRIRVNDGFDEASASTGCLKVVARGPRVTLSDPTPGTRFAMGAALFAAGDAFDDGAHTVPPDRLRWYVNGKQVGSGNSVSYSGFAPGANTLELRATDSHGRTGTATLKLSCGDGRKDRFCVVR